MMLDRSGLTPSSRGARVRFSGPHRTMIDGPFAETKELIAGFWLWKVDSMQQAIEWLKKCPNPMIEDSEIEIRPYFENEEFGEAFTSELKEQEASIRTCALGAEQANVSVWTGTFHRWFETKLHDENSHPHSTTMGAFRFASGKHSQLEERGVLRSLLEHRTGLPFRLPRERRSCWPKQFAERVRVNETRRETLRRFRSHRPCLRDSKDNRYDLDQWGSRLRTGDR